MKKSEKFTSLKVLSLCSFIFLSFMFLVSCDKDNPASSRTITCEAGCSSMSWHVSGESGGTYYEASCNRTYNAYGNYSETCTGTVTYDNSGDTYNFTATYNWIDCSISITVTGVGSCSDQVNSAGLSKDCDCGESSGPYAFVKYKDL
jgi:hypothetical protein